MDKPTPDARSWRERAHAAKGLALRFTVVRALAEDRLLALLFLALAIGGLVPLLCTPFLPFTDLGSNIGAAGLLIDAALKRGVVGYHYWVQFKPLPYWTGYLIMALASAVGGPMFAAKFLMGLIVVLLPLCVMRLLIAMGRSPRMGLWAFALVWDHNAYWGWLTFQLGMCLALVAIAKFIECRTWRQTAWLFGWMVVLAFSHVHAVVLAATAGGLIAFLKKPVRGSLLRHAVAMTGGAVVLAPWLWTKLLSKAMQSDPAAQLYQIDWHKLPDKLASLFKYTLDNTPLPAGQILTSVAFVLLLIGPVALNVLPRRELDVRGRLMPFTVLATALGYYLALPFALWGPIEHWYTYPRFATYILVGLSLVPMARFARWEALALAPGIIAALAVDWSVASQMLELAPRMRPYVEIIDKIEPGTRLFPNDLTDADSASKASPFGQFHGYAAAAKHLYDPHLFDDVNNPLQFMSKRKLPSIWWRRQTDFSMDGQGVYYDYVIVRGLAQDKVKVGATSKGPVVKLVHEAGEWRLYHIEGRLPYP